MGVYHPLSSHFKKKQLPLRIHGTGIFTYTCTIKNPTIHGSGEYTSPMDLMGRPRTASWMLPSVHAALRSILSTSRRGMEIINCCACCFVLAPIHNRKPRKVLRSKLSCRLSKVVFCLFEMVSSSISNIFCFSGALMATCSQPKNQLKLESLNKTLGGGLTYFLFSPWKLGKMNPCWLICFRWVDSTTNQLLCQQIAQDEWAIFNSKINSWNAQSWRWMVQMMIRISIGWPFRFQPLILEGIVSFCYLARWLKGTWSNKKQQSFNRNNATTKKYSTTIFFCSKRRLLLVPL